MKPLPKVYQSPILKKIDNYQSTYHVDRKVKNTFNIKDINKKINEIFASSNHIYKSKVKIYFKDKEIEEIIIGKTNTHLLTMDKKLIKITDIINIEKI